MKLRSLLLIIIFTISGLGIAIYAGFFLFPYLIPIQDGPNINYIAPYINNTHACYTHTHGCSAEIPNQRVNYNVWDNDGNINITNSVITGPNGFFKLDLQIDKNWIIQIETVIDEKFYQGTTNFSTFAGSANCITTGQLVLL